jgi:hypothetical protein
MRCSREAAEPVEFGDHQLIAGAVGRQQRLVQFRPGGELAGSLVDKDVLASSRGQSVVLCFGVLIARRDAPVADSHAAQRIANPRQVDIAAYTATFTDLACANLLPPRVSRERSYPNTAVRVAASRRAMIKTWWMTQEAVPSRMTKLSKGFDHVRRANVGGKVRPMLNAPHLVALVRAGATFIRGELVERPGKVAA